MTEASDQVDYDDTDEAPESDIAKTPSEKIDRWKPPPTAHHAMVNRTSLSGEIEHCAIYDEQSGEWVEKFPVPLSALWVLQRWGSGRYTVMYQKADNTTAGRGPTLDLIKPEFPTASHRAGGPKVRQRAPVQAPPQAPPLSPITGMPKPPAMPRGVDASALLELAAYFEEKAMVTAQQRIMGTEMFWRQQLVTEQSARQRDLEEAEARHRREREETDARFGRLLSEMRNTHEQQLKLAASTSGKAALSAELEELGQELDELKEEKEKPAGFGGNVLAFFKPMLESEEGRAKLVQVMAAVAQQFAQKPV